MTTDTTPLQERINDAFLSEEPWTAAVKAVMRHEGYTDEEISKAHGPLAHTEECADNGYPFGYDCTDEEGRDQHPLHTRADELGDTYRLFFEESPLAAAILPLIAAEVRKAQGEAWTDCISEASALGWLHAPAALDMLDRNPHETEDQT